MSHCRPISRRLGVAASAVLILLAISCSDLTLPIDTSRSSAELIALPMAAGAPAPTPRSFYVSNARRTVQRLQHADNFNTTFLELDFPPMSLASLDGSILSNDDSVLVTVSPRSGEYGFLISPAGLVMSSSASPTVTLSFGVYGDATVGSTSGSYSTSAAYVDALDIWHEQTVDLWRIAGGSGSTGTDAVSARLELAGSFLLAAPR